MKTTSEAGEVLSLGQSEKGRNIGLLYGKSVDK